MRGLPNLEILRPHSAFAPPVSTKIPQSSPLPLFIKIHKFNVVQNILQLIILTWSVMSDIYLCNWWNQCQLREDHHVIINTTGTEKLVILKLLDDLYPELYWFNNLERQWWAKNIGQSIDDDTAIINLSPWQSGEFELPPLLDVHVQAQFQALYSPADDPSSLACVYHMVLLSKT